MIKWRLKDPNSSPKFACSSRRVHANTADEDVEAIMQLEPSSVAFFEKVDVKPAKTEKLETKEEEQPAKKPK